MDAVSQRRCEPADERLEAAFETEKPSGSFALLPARQHRANQTAVFALHLHHQRKLRAHGQRAAVSRRNARHGRVHQHVRGLAPDSSSSKVVDRFVDLAGRRGTANGSQSKRSFAPKLSALEVRSARGDPGTVRNSPFLTMKRRFASGRASTIRDSRPSARTMLQCFRLAVQESVRPTLDDEAVLVDGARMPARLAGVEQRDLDARAEVARLVPQRMGRREARDASTNDDDASRAHTVLLKTGLADAVLARRYRSKTMQTLRMNNRPVGVTSIASGLTRTRPSVVGDPSAVSSINSWEK